MRDSAEGAVSFAYKAENRLPGVTWISRWHSPRPRFLLRRRAESAHPFRGRRVGTPCPYWFCGQFTLPPRRAHRRDGRIAAYTVGATQYNLGYDDSELLTRRRIFVFYPGMQGGFTAQGTISLTYTNLPTGSKVRFHLRAGTIPCQSTNTPPTVSLTAPGSGVVFTAPANITVSANAADSDGTVTQVEFYQGATLIGTAATAPYAITWSNVTAGTYSLTAKATDNQGATTTSAPVTVIVNSPPTVSLTSPASGATYKEVAPQI